MRTMGRASETTDEELWPRLGEQSRGLGVPSDEVTYLRRRLAELQEEKVQLIRSWDAERAMRQKEQETAKRVGELKQEHARLVAHDLRTPLNSISMGTELLLREKAEQSLSPISVKVIEKMSSAARAMRDLVEDLVDTDQLEAGVLQLNPTLCDFGSLVREALFSGLSVEQERRVEWAGSVEGAWVLADVRRFGRAVLNLVSNALRFSPATEPVQLRIERSAAHAVLVVRDSGREIGPEDLDHVFDKYWVSTRSRSQGGGGLGLYICRLIAEAHGGCCSVQSAPGSGTTFTLSLPNAETEPA